MPVRRLAAMTVDLRSDTFTRPTPAMRRAMAEAEVGDDVWGEDPTIKRLEAVVAERLGHEAALFVPSGTMGNQICLRLAAPPGTECLANEDNHILWYEAAAAPVLSGVQLHPVAGPRGLLDPAAARSRVRTARYGVPTSAIAVEQTHNRAGGAIQPLEVLQGLRELADEAGLHLHCDGARIWNASVASGVPLERYGALFDSLSVCFSKALAAPVGSAVVGHRDLVERAREVRHLYGGAMRQAGVLAAAALVALDQMVDRLADDHANARALAETVATAVPGSLDPAAVQTNMVLLATGAFGTDGPGLVKRLADLGVLAADTDPDRVRLVFHYEVTADDAERAARAVVAAAQ
jgi:threonine aldolase